ncbi:MAG TPA: penicillin acylase family protein [Pyrinomonadaceae bacterium]
MIEHKTRANMKPDLASLLQVSTVVAVLLFTINAFGAPSSAELARWQRESRNVKITRDDWGIAHVVGKTDADAVFGMIYAQAEDDFNRVETNYVNALGQLAQAEGESAIWQDLRMKMFIDPDQLKKDYAASPAWLRKLMDAWADGLNFYLAKHPNVKPRVITHFEPWMALSFSEGSIGGDIETINLNRLRDFYGTSTAAAKLPSWIGGVDAVSADEVVDRWQTSEADNFLKEPTGSNGIAISPANTVDHHALLLINPHTSFYFRSELQMTSGEGLNAYGAVTWGQFFVYQGFNDHCGWMHTSSAVDAIDEFRESVTKQGNGYVYKFGDKELPITETSIRVPYKTANGTMAEKVFIVYRTKHGPVIRKDENGNWITISLMQKPIDALTQSYIRTKARNYAEFRKSFELHSDSSNNTIYADAEGNIAYFHANYIPRRDPKFDWTKPVDGSDPATDYKGLLSVDETPKLFNPASGWLYNSNDSPWQSAGPSSPRQTDFPKYVDSGTESARGHHVQRVLRDRKDFSLDGLRRAAYDSYLMWFEKPIPALIKAWDSAPANDPLKVKLAEQIDLLRKWDVRWAVDSIPTTLAVYWGEDLQRRLGQTARAAGVPMDEYVATKASGDQLLSSLAAASDRLTADFGTWKTPWGRINCFQRITDDIVHPFTDSGPCQPVGFTSGNWGSIASFGAIHYKGSKRMYGTSGNSFVAVVEFGPQIHARAVTAGGESGDPMSKHFTDEAKRYATGDLREVYFYPTQLKGHTEKTYVPGD